MDEGLVTTFYTISCNKLQRCTGKYHNVRIKSGIYCLNLPMFMRNLACREGSRMENPFSKHYFYLAKVTVKNWSVGRDTKNTAEVVRTGFTIKQGCVLSKLVLENNRTPIIFLPLRGNAK